MDEAGIAAARRGIDAGVGARCREHAERRHRDEFFGMHVDRRPRLGDDARRRFCVDCGEVARRKVGQGSSPDRVWTRPYTASAGTKQLMMMRPEWCTYHTTAC